MSFCNNQNEEVLNILCDNTKKIGINTNQPTSVLDINSNSIRIRDDSTTPTSSTVGEKGEIRWNQDALYICNGFDGTNYKWKKANLVDI